ncbi:hypothetical protein [Abyssisolibacter fermentans]|uniref:hypothetical protein n=1 Tax=Abyssisolibacter fermentans TaxID=1766203 RepID=UPI000831DE52|nr:hypothetical protein [Abyssisolibacter fermentans]
MVNNKKNDLGRNNKEKNRKKYNKKWICLISIWTFILTIFFSLVSENMMRGFNIALATIALLILITLGVFFDLIGIAVAAADEKPFHSMAANGVKEAKYAVRLVRNAARVSSFCNDVIGDICGILSGAAGAIIVVKIITLYEVKTATIVSILVSAIIASLTVGGKAFGKEMGIRNSEKIIFHTSKVLFVINTKLGIDFLPELKRKR